MKTEKPMTGSSRLNKIYTEALGAVNQDISIFWFRRDLRLNDNTGLYYALTSGRPVVLIFIFDEAILEGLPGDDARVSFIYENLEKLNGQISGKGSSLIVFKGNYKKVWKDIASWDKVKSVFWNTDYEPYALARDKEVKKILGEKGIETHTFKDQVIFEKDEIVKNDSSAYTVYTPYSRKWLRRLESEGIPQESRSENHLDNLAKISVSFPGISLLGFTRSGTRPEAFRKENIENYDSYRDYPHLDATTHAGPHLRFGTLSIRQVVKTAYMLNRTFLSELIWREFFMQILYHFPHVTAKSFRPKYDNIRWINDEKHFGLWCRGQTGYPLVDAGMRQLNTTGFMHNRVRMVTASFLCKHLLIDWRWGEKYFAEKLLDYELSSNNGNWQWAAGTGCDAAPYFRVFNPYQQARKFDGENKYIHKWLPELNTPDYPPPLIDHPYARERAISTYRYY
ncbi:MAG: deoxyribodipyrimidine photo-lyase, partial [Bacteroidales bacterium]|nr:deoxyribodipyrimidine photo-lyase [Bacteroidales bacterium]